MQIKDMLKHCGILNTALEDGIIGDDESETLREMRKKMYLAVLKKSLKLDRNTVKTIEDDVLIKHKIHSY